VSFAWQSTIRAVISKSFESIIWNDNVFWIIIKVIWTSEEMNLLLRSACLLLFLWNDLNSLEVLSEIVCMVLHHQYGVLSLSRRLTYPYFKGNSRKGQHLSRSLWQFNALNITTQGTHSLVTYQCNDDDHLSNLLFLKRWLYWIQSGHRCPASGTVWRVPRGLIHPGWTLGFSSQIYGAKPGLWRRVWSKCSQNCTVKDINDIWSQWIANRVN
jgi:hypothetical protein